MTGKTQTVNRKAGAAGKGPVKVEDAIVNDSLGTVSPADSTGVDEDKETGDARRNNFPTRED